MTSKALVSAENPKAMIREVRESLEDRLVGSQNIEQVNLLLLLLGEVQETKYFFDKMREGDNGVRNLIDLTKEQSRWLKMVETLLKGVQDLDKIEWNNDDLISVTNFVLLVVKDIIIKDFGFDQAQTDRFLQILKSRKKEIDDFVSNVADNKR
jgi:hypothetical protein